MKQVNGMSGHCATGAGHQTCWGQWTTPSAEVTCRCECHTKKVIVPKGSKKLVPKG